jgi:small-conductance mechanosensitive channel
MVYSFKHIFSTNHFYKPSVKLGESITIIDKEFDITGRVSDIGLFYVIMKTETDEKIMIPNNLFTKQQKINSEKIAVILLLCFLFHYP